jgi:hypothetical protein
MAREVMPADVRKARQDFVSSHIFEKTGAIARGRNRGDMAQSTTTVDGVTMYVCAWLDTKPVHILSTIPSSVGECQRRVKEGGAWGEKDFPRPSQIGKYNHGMKGTDLGDQKTAYYAPLMKGNSWSPRVLTDATQRMIVNAQILFKKQQVAKKLTTREYQRAVILGLCAPHLKKLGNPDPAEAPEDLLRLDNKRTRKQWCEDPLRPGCRGRKGGHIHVIKTCQITEGRIDNKEFTKKRGDCKICGKSCSTFCVACEVFLCIDVADMSCKSCDDIFHWDDTFPPPSKRMKGKSSKNKKCG